MLLKDTFKRLPLKYPQANLNSWETNRNCLITTRVFRNLQSELDEVRHKSQQLNTETEELREELKRQGNMNTAKIGSLSRYALTHPDRGYV